MRFLFLLLVLASCASNRHECQDKNDEKCVKAIQQDRMFMFIDRNPR